MRSRKPRRERMLAGRFPLLLGVCLLAAAAEAQTMPDNVGTSRIRPNSVAEDTCRVIAEEAVARGLPPGFFARLIWKESAFSPGAVSSKGARGIAQFMAATAAERSLKDPFDPAPALAASAGYLAALRAQFGNLGLAAAAYNAGPSRVRGWLDGTGFLPAETQDYVHWITGHPVEDWSKARGELPLPPVAGRLAFGPACVKLALRELPAHVPKTFRPAAAAGGEAPGMKRVKASEPGRVRVLFQIGGPAKPQGSKRRR